MQLLDLASVIRQYCCDSYVKGVIEMRHADLSPSTQLILIGLLAVIWAAFVMRAVIFFRREKCGVRSVYPSDWTAVQRRTLEYFRQLVGLALIPLWVVFLLIAPLMPTSWPFGFVEVISLISMLLLSYAWVLLLTPRNWNTETVPQSFGLTIAFLVVWWGLAFTAVGWMFVEVSAAPPLGDYSNGIYAAKRVAPCSSCLIA